MTDSRMLLRLVAAGLTALALLGCGKPGDPNDYPVSHWLENGDDCVRASAAAVMKSGLPFPNYGTENVPGPAGQPPKKRVTTVDMWVGPTRFVIPAAVAYSDGAYPRTHPRRYEGLRGTLPTFYPPGPPAEEIDGMGAIVEVNFRCAMDEKYVASWGKGYQSNAEGIEQVKAQYEADALRFDSKRAGPSKVSINRREDIGMIEVLYERSSAKYADGMPMWEATYWPINGELKGPSGNVSAVKCATRSDPVHHRYGNRGWRCTSGMRLTSYASAYIEIYVSHIQEMPAVFEQVRKLLVTAQQPSVY